MISIAFAIMLGLVLWQFFNIDIVVSWLVAVNLVTFAMYGFDKSVARRGGKRISERELLILALIGGSLGAILGMQVFRHKSKKRSFQMRLLLILLVQVVLVIAYIFYLA